MAEDRTIYFFRLASALDDGDWRQANWLIQNIRGGADDGGVAARQDGTKRVSVYAQVDDLQATLDKAEKLGGKTILSPTELADGPTIALFADDYIEKLGLP
jgi:hypothetical protein